jgi:hypothetical protein
MMMKSAAIANAPFAVMRHPVAFRQILNSQRSISMLSSIPGTFTEAS